MVGKVVRSSSQAIDHRVELTIGLTSGWRTVATPDFATNSGTCGYGNRSYLWSENGREAESLREVIDSWPSLPPHIVQAILALVRTARG